MREIAIRACVCIIVVGAPVTIAAQAHFLRGDANHDRDVDVSDAVTTLLYLFAESSTPPCLDSLDVDDDGTINITDAINVLGYLFTGGTPPATPYPIFEADPTADALTCLPEVPGAAAAGGSILTGDIAVDLHLVPDRTYRIVSGAYIKPGATLTIDAGVTILGDRATAAFLAVERGAMVYVNGTDTHPVVFTSDRAVGSRRAGDWGGFLICGRGPANVVGGEWVVKGFANLWAGGGAAPDPTESSGRVSHVRVEFAGANVMGFPLTAITFAALGSGTELDHVMAKFGRDDGIEWYGGTCSLRHGIAFGVEDDGIDCEYGWTGKAQYMVCLQNPTAGNNGWQAAEDDTQPLLEPRTIPTLSNVTILGAYATGSRSANGIRPNRWAGINLYNGIIQGWHTAGIGLGSNFGPVAFDRCAFYANAANCTGSATTCAAIFQPPLQNLVASGSLVVDAATLEDPDLRGVASRLPPALDPTGIDPWFEPAMYAGAVPPEGEGEDWTHARWISWRKN